MATEAPPAAVIVMILLFVAYNWGKTIAVAARRDNRASIFVIAYSLLTLAFSIAALGTLTTYPDFEYWHCELICFSLDVVDYWEFAISSLAAMSPAWAWPPLILACIYYEVWNINPAGLLAEQVTTLARSVNTFATRHFEVFQDAVSGLRRYMLDELNLHCDDLGADDMPGSFPHMRTQQPKFTEEVVDSHGSPIEEVVESHNSPYEEVAKSHGLHTKEVAQSHGSPAPSEQPSSLDDTAADHAPRSFVLSELARSNMEHIREYMATGSAHIPDASPADSEAGAPDFPVFLPSGSYQHSIQAQIAMSAAKPLWKKSSIRDQTPPAAQDQAPQEPVTVAESSEPGQKIGISRPKKVQFALDPVDLPRATMAETLQPQLTQAPERTSTSTAPVHALGEESPQVAIPQPSEAVMPEVAQQAIQYEELPEQNPVGSGHAQLIILSTIDQQSMENVHEPASEAPSQPLIVTAVAQLTPLPKVMDRSAELASEVARLLTQEPMSQESAFQSSAARQIVPSAMDYRSTGKSVEPASEPQPQLMPIPEEMDGVEETYVPDSGDSPMEDAGSVCQSTPAPRNAVSVDNTQIFATQVNVHEAEMQDVDRDVDIGETEEMAEHQPSSYDSAPMVEPAHDEETLPDAEAPVEASAASGAAMDCDDDVEIGAPRRFIDNQTPSQVDVALFQSQTPNAELRGTPFGKKSGQPIGRSTIPVAPFSMTPSVPQATASANPAAASQVQQAQQANSFAATASTALVQPSPTVAVPAPGNDGTANQAQQVQQTQPVGLSAAPANATNAQPSAAAAPVNPYLTWQLQHAPKKVTTFAPWLNIADAQAPATTAPGNNAAANQVQHAQQAQPGPPAVTLAANPTVNALPQQANQPQPQAVVAPAPAPAPAPAVTPAANPTANALPQQANQPQPQAVVASAPAQAPTQSALPNFPFEDQLKPIDPGSGAGELLAWLKPASATVTKMLNYTFNTPAAIRSLRALEPVLKTLKDEHIDEGIWTSKFGLQFHQVAQELSTSLQELTGRPANQVPVIARTCYAHCNSLLEAAVCQRKSMLHQAVTSYHSGMYKMTKGDSDSMLAQVNTGPLAAALNKSRGKLPLVQARKHLGAAKVALHKLDSKEWDSLCRGENVGCRVALEKFIDKLENWLAIHHTLANDDWHKSLADVCRDLRVELVDGKEMAKNFDSAMT